MKIDNSVIADAFEYLPTALAWEVMQSPPSVRPSVRLFPLYLRNLPTVDLERLHAGRS